MPLESREVDVLVANKVERCLGVLLLELESLGCSVHQFLPEALFRHKSDLTIIHLSDSLTKHMIHDALFPLLAHNLLLFLSQALLVHLVDIVDFLSHLLFLITSLSHCHPSVLLNLCLLLGGQVAIVHLLKW